MCPPTTTAPTTITTTITIRSYSIATTTIHGAVSNITLTTATCSCTASTTTIGGGLICSTGFAVRHAVEIRITSKGNLKLKVIAISNSQYESIGSKLQW